MVYSVNNKHFVVIENVLFFPISSSFHPLSVCAHAAVAEDPEFTDIIENVTVPAGRNVRMACSVKNLGSFKVIVTHLTLNKKKRFAFSV